MEDIIPVHVFRDGGKNVRYAQRGNTIQGRTKGKRVGAWYEKVNFVEYANDGPQSRSSVYWGVMARCIFRPCTLLLFLLVGSSENIDMMRDA